MIGSTKTVAPILALVVALLVGMSWLLLGKNSGTTVDLPGVAASSLTFERLWDGGVTATPDWMILHRPVDICADPFSHLLVLDRAEARIIRFSADGSLVDIIGRRGNGPGEFLQPGLMSISEEDTTLWVADGITLTGFALSPDGHSLLCRSTFGTYSIFPRELLAAGPYKFWIVSNLIRPPAIESPRISLIDTAGTVHRAFGAMWSDALWNRGVLQGMNEGLLEDNGTTLIFCWKRRPLIEF